MNKYGKNCNTQTVLYPFLVLAQCFALFPVKGIKGNNSGTVSFSWFSKKTFYALFYLAVSLVNLCFFFIKQINTEDFFSTFVGLIYFTTILLIEVFFLNLAENWPYLMQKWSEVDSFMALYTYSHILGYKLKFTTLFVMTLAFGEHALFIATKFSVIRSNNLTNTEIFEIYFKRYYDQFFNIIPYNIYIGVLIEVFDIYCVFAWNYKDLFIMLISIIISERYSQLLTKIKLMSKYKITVESHWQKVREDYIRLTALCKLINHILTNIIILSFTHNLFIVLIQFMYTLHDTSQTYIQSFYFIYSFGFLIARTVSVCLFAAEVDHKSRKPLEVLTSLPQEMYNIEVERFILQITIDPAYLSGGDFFIVTRSLVLRIAGAVVTYELVLIQMLKYR